MKLDLIVDPVGPLSKTIGAQHTQSTRQSEVKSEELQKSKNRTR